MDDKLSTTETIKLSLAFCIIWFLANYTTNASLAYTSVGSSTILASMSGMRKREMLYDINSRYLEKANINQRTLYIGYRSDI
jgi:hypothetical protein